MHPSAITVFILKFLMYLSTLGVAWSVRDSLLGREGIKPYWSPGFKKMKMAFQGVNSKYMTTRKKFLWERFRQIL